MKGNGGHSSENPSHSMGMPARDLARIAYRMLHDGRWQDRQVITHWFVQKTGALTHDVKTPEMRFKRNAQSFSHGWELPARLKDKRGEDFPADARYKPAPEANLLLLCLVWTWLSHTKLAAAENGNMKNICAGHVRRCCPDSQGRNRETSNPLGTGVLTGKYKEMEEPAKGMLWRRRRNQRRIISTGLPRISTIDSSSQPNSTMRELSFLNTKKVDSCSRYWALAFLASAHLFLFLMGTVCLGTHEGEDRKMRIAVVQSVIENTLEQNRDKILSFIPQAKAAGCEVVIFPESSLYWSEISVDNPKKADIDAAVYQIGQKAKSEGIYVIFSSQNKYTDNGDYHNLGIVYDGEGSCLVSYVKNSEVPRAFFVNGVPFNISVCSDRGYLEHSDLPCLAQGAQVIVDTSGGHGGDDGRPYLPLIRYRPWAVRTNAFVIVCNPPHDDTDFMGNSPWGGGSAIIRSDGTIQAKLEYEKEIMIVEEIDLSLATRAEAERRENNPILKPFWDMGKTLIDGGNIPSMPDITPYKSQEREVKIAAAQIACSRIMADNVKKITDQIQQAARQGADVVVFPELAVTGSRKEDIESADQEALNAALSQIKDQARKGGTYVIVGMPYFVDGKRKNCAFVIGDDGNIKTRYEQLNATRTDLFQPGSSIKNVWFQLKGVYSIVTMGEDSKWVEIADLAANRGMYLHFHISYAADATADDAVLRRQQNLLMLTYARYGAVVNAADPVGLPDPSSSASGVSMIVSREGGHNRPAPDDLEHYLPYQTSVVKSTGSEETMIYATRKTTTENNMDLMRNWRNRTRHNRAQKGWYDWIKFGAQMVEK